MIDRLAHILAIAFPDGDAEQLAEALWLAALGTQPDNGYADHPVPPPEGRAKTYEGDPDPPDQPHGPPGSSELLLPSREFGPTASEGIRVTEVGLRLSGTATLPGTTAAALSLFRRVHQPGPQVFDVDATVEATADARRLVVVTRPGRERGLDVAIVVDPTAVAMVWADAIDELAGTLRRTGAFRTVSLWSLDGFVHTGSGELLIWDSVGVAHSVGSLVDPAGRRLVLLLNRRTGDSGGMAE